MLRLRFLLPRIGFVDREVQIGSYWILPTHHSHPWRPLPPPPAWVWRTWTSWVRRSLVRQSQCGIDLCSSPRSSLGALAAAWPRASMKWMFGSDWVVLPWVLSDDVPRRSGGHPLHVRYAMRPWAVPYLTIKRDRDHVRYQFQWWNDSLLPQEAWSYCTP